jgi:hypothetical protein
MSTWNTFNEIADLRRELAEAKARLAEFITPMTCGHSRIYLDEAEGSCTMCQQQARIAVLGRVATTALTLLAKLDTMHADGAYAAVWTSYAIHGGVYRGPQYVDEKSAVQRELDALATLPPSNLAAGYKANAEQAREACAETDGGKP